MIITINNQSFDITVKEADGNYAVIIDNELKEIFPQFDRYGKISSIIIDGHKYLLQINKSKESYLIGVTNKIVTANIRKTVETTEHPANIENYIIVRSPMAGLVVNLPVKAGERIAKDRQLLILEAMKMQNEIRAPFDALVIEVFVIVGQTVGKDSKLVALEKL